MDKRNLESEIPQGLNPDIREVVCIRGTQFRGCLRFTVSAAER